jgi:branched-chain amino acid transport system permease protein
LSYDLLLLVVGPGVLAALWLIARTRFGVPSPPPRIVRSRARWASTSGCCSRQYSHSAPCCRLAGALQLPRAGQSHGLAIIAEAFVVTVVGGLGSIPGAFSRHS